MVNADLANIVKRLSEVQGRPMNAILNDAVAAYVDKTPLEPTDLSIVDFLLLEGHPARPAAIDNGGRWFLNWLLRSEPSWQHHHMVLLPRHWPLQVSRHERRCHSNGGDFRSVNDHLSELAGRRFPSKFSSISEKDWATITTTFIGCCGEKLRPPNAPHWNAICM